MKAAIHTTYGPPEVIQIKETDKPVPGPNDLLIKVYASTVNRTDCAILRAKPLIMRFFTGLLKPNNQISGTDFAGVVESIGNKVTQFKPGDKVFGFNDMGIRSHAEYMVYPEKFALSIIPEAISFEQAAASIEGAHYAYNMINKVTLNKGDKVLVNGASGAIGSAVVQLLKYSGAEITAVCNTKNIELIKSIGASTVIDYTKNDFTQTNEKYKFIFDAAGKSTFGKCKPLLEKKGTYISTELGPNSQNIFLALYTPLFNKKKVRFPFPYNIQRSTDLMRKLLDEGNFKPIIDRNYSLDKIVEAFRYVETGEKTGNVIISVI